MIATHSSLTRNVMTLVGAFFGCPEFGREPPRVFTLPMSMGLIQVDSICQNIWHVGIKFSCLLIYRLKNCAVTGAPAAELAETAGYPHIFISIITPPYPDGLSVFLVTQENEKRRASQNWDISLNSSFPIELLDSFQMVNPSWDRPKAYFVQVDTPNVFLFSPKNQTKQSNCICFSATVGMKSVFFIFASFSDTTCTVW